MIVACSLCYVQFDSHDGGRCCYLACRAIACPDHEDEQFPVVERSGEYVKRKCRTCATVYEDPS